MQHYHLNKNNFNLPILKEKKKHELRFGNTILNMNLGKKNLNHDANSKSRAKDQH